MSVPMKWVLTSMICLLFGAFSRWDANRSADDESEDGEMAGSIARGIGALFTLLGIAFALVAAFKAVWLA